MAELKAVVFEVGNEYFGIEISHAERILTAQKTTKLPRSPQAMLGIFELMGSTVPVFDLSKRLGFEGECELHNDVIVKSGDLRYGLRVSRMVGIWNFTEGQLEEKHEAFNNDEDPFIQMIGKQNDRLVVILDAEYILPGQLKKAAVKALTAA